MEKFQLTIPEPCHENWEQMTPREKGRFCGSCQKTVVDFTNMSDREIADFYKKSPSKVCGHFNQDQLDRDIAIQKKRMPWIRYFFQISIPAILVSVKASAQGQVIMKGDTVCVPTDTTKRKCKTPANESNIIEGVITDKNGIGIPFAVVKIVGTNYGTAADAKGAFRIKVPEMNSYLEISSVGFLSRTVKVADSSKTIVLEMQFATTGEVVIVSTHKRKKKDKAIPLTTKIIDTAFKNFKVYPNPAQNNSYLKIDCSKLESGEYVLSIIDMSGEVLQTQEVLVDGKRKQIEFLLEEVTRGAYVVHLFNRKTTASFTEKIIVQ